MSKDELRAAMPITAEIVDDYRHFLADGGKLIFASENGHSDRPPRAGERIPGVRDSSRLPQTHGGEEEMKPRISVRYGIWRCRSVLDFSSYFLKVDGYGHTPKEAYDDWTRESEVRHD
jgi:hypothetical protein